MSLRKVPGALALGLLASLAAHAALFGDAHAMGGIYHVILIQAALGAAVSLVVFFSALGWSASTATADGSVIASRLRDQLPGLGSVIASAGAWYAIVEAIEPQHAGASALLAAALLSSCAWLVLRLAVAVARAVGAVFFAIFGASFAPRLPASLRRPQPARIARRRLFARRRFARPPPAIVAAIRA